MGLEDLTCFPRFDTEAEQAIANQLWACGDVPWILHEGIQEFPKDLSKLPRLLSGRPALYIFDADARDSYGASSRAGVLAYIQQVQQLKENPFLRRVKDLTTSSQVHIPLRPEKNTTISYYVLDQGRLRHERTSTVTERRDYFVKLPHLFSAEYFTP